VDDGQDEAGTERAGGHAEHLRRQRVIIDRVVEVFARHPQVLGAALTGSYASGRPDAFSDIDLGCFLRDEARTGQQAVADAVAAVAPTLHYGTYYGIHALYLFEDGVRFDLSFGGPERLPHWQLPRSTILYDPDGALAEGFGRTASPEPAEHPPDFAGNPAGFVTWYLWMFRQAYAWKKRGAQGGIRGFDKFRIAAESLATVRNHLVPMRLWTLGERDYLARIDPAFAGRLAQTYPHLELDELLRCARLLLAEFEAVTPAYCERAGIDYPREKVAALKRILEEFDALD